MVNLFVGGGSGVKNPFEDLMESVGLFPLEKNVHQHIPSKLAGCFRGTLNFKHLRTTD